MEPADAMQLLLSFDSMFVDVSSAHASRKYVPSAAELGTGVLTFSATKGIQNAPEGGSCPFSKRRT